MDDETVEGNVSVTMGFKNLCCHTVAVLVIVIALIGLPSIHSHANESAGELFALRDVAVINVERATSAHQEILSDSDCMACAVVSFMSPRFVLFDLSRVESAGLTFVSRRVPEGDGPPLFRPPRL